VSGKHNKTIVLCLALLIGGGWVALAAQSGQPAEPESPPADHPLSFLDDPNLAGATGAGLGSRELFLKMALSVALVVALGAAAMVVSRRVLPKVARTSGREIRVLETTYLGPRKALHLVEVGNHRLLVGSTNENITALAHIGDTWLDVPGQELDETVKR